MLKEYWLEILIAAVLIALLVALVQAAIKEEKEWEVFKTEHACPVRLLVKQKAS